MNELLSVSHSIPLGTIVFLLDMEKLYVRVDQSWQEILVSSGVHATDVQCRGPSTQHRTKIVKMGRPMISKFVNHP